MAVWGLDVEQVRALSGQLEQKASDIDGILQQLTGALSNTQWEGPDATQFRSDWTGPHSAALKQVAAALRDAGQRAKQNAAQQEAASR